MIREKYNGVKIATTIIFDEMDKEGANFHFLLGMLHFAKRFGAITEKEQAALIQYLEERGK